MIKARPVPDPAAHSQRIIGRLIYLHDLIMAGLAMFAVLIVRYRFELKPTPYGMVIVAITVYVMVCAAVFWLFRLNRGIWRFTTLNDVWQICQAVVLANLLLLPALFLLDRLTDFPRSAPLLASLATIGCLSFGRILVSAGASGGLRAGLILEDLSKPPVLLVAEDQNAADFLRANQRSDHPMRIVGIVSPNPSLSGRSIDGCKVLGRIEQLTPVLEGFRVSEALLPQVVVADPNPSRALLDAVVAAAGEAGVRVTRARPVAGGTQALAPVQAADLLARPPRPLDANRARGLVAGKRVLVTGAGGTIGGELTRQILSYEPASLILFDASEFNLYTIDRELAESRTQIPWRAELGDVRDLARLAELFAREKPQIVLHAAALKHVPLMEANPAEAVLTNVAGALAVARLARDMSEVFVFVSTDKAVNPTNVMGATKRVAEHGISALMAGGQARAAVVRFGNVLGSAGSVVPLFERQIAAGGPLTLTHPDMVRYFMTVQEAAGLVLQAAALPQAQGSAGIYVLDMGEPVRIEDMAEKLIRLHGLRPGRDIALVHTGLRPGEKLYEELFYTEEDVSATAADGVMAARTQIQNWSDIEAALASLQDAAQRRDQAAVIAGLCALEPEFVPDQRP
jgi:O-antigen biosynthesis protein WbqV